MKLCDTSADGDLVNCAEGRFKADLIFVGINTILRWEMCKFCHGKELLANLSQKSESLQGLEFGKDQLQTYKKDQAKIS